MNINAKIVLKLVDIISWPLWVVDFLKRHGSLTTILFWVSVASILISINFGIAVLIGIVGMVGRLAFAGMFMIFQFVVLFSFLSSTRTIEMFPGDKGMVSFEKDYFGNDYLVTAVRQWVSSLSIDGKKQLDDMGAAAINGLLFEGPTGTGKTLLAQCLANDSHAAFFGVSGSDFQAMFIGVGPMKVMRMYSKARAAASKYGACIVFIDEIDSIGGNRGGVSRDNPVAGGMAGGMFGGGGLGVLSKLLTELDGTKEIGRRDRIRNKARVWLGVPELYRGLILTIGATNRYSALDPALIRPGRIDKIIRVDPPDRNSRKKIIEGYLSKVKHDDSVDVQMLTDDTQGVSPAQLASSIQRSAPRHAINGGRAFITQADIDAALQEDLVGLKNPIEDMDKEQKTQVAIHEAGHAVASYIRRPQRKMTHLSIVRRGSGILGYLRDVEQKEVYAMPLQYYKDNIVVSMAGHAAVSIVMGQPWTGGSVDFDHVRGYLRQMALYGQLGGIPQDPFDPFKNHMISEARDSMERELWNETVELLVKERTLLDAVSSELLKKEELTSSEVYAILGAIP